MTKARTTKAPNFEKALGSLEELVDNLEEGLPVEEAIKQYEKSVKLAKECLLALKSAQMRVKVLMEESEELETISGSEFDEEE